MVPELIRLLAYLVAVASDSILVSFVYLGVGHWEDPNLAVKVGNDRFLAVLHPQRMGWACGRKNIVVGRF